MPDKVKGYLAVTASATLWGLAAVAVKFMFVNHEADPVVLSQFRLTLTAVGVGLVLALVRPALLRVRRSDLPFLALYGTAGFAGVQIFYYLAIQAGNVAVAIFLQFLAPVFTALYEVTVLGRRPGPVTYGVLVLAIGGSAFLVFGRDGGGMAISPLGLLAGLVAAVFLAFYGLAGRYGVRRFNSWTLLFWGMCFGSLLWAVVRPPWVVWAQPPSAMDWAFYAYLAVFATALPFGLFLWGLRHIGATSAIIVGTLEPVWATVLSHLFLHDRLSLLQLLGALLILTAVIALQVVPGAALEDAPLRERANRRP